MQLQISRNFLNAIFSSQTNLKRMENYFKFKYKVHHVSATMNKLYPHKCMTGPADLLFSQFFFIVNENYLYIAVGI